MEWTSALVLLSLAYGGTALQWSARCQTQPGGLTVAATGLVPARYTVQWCSREAASARVLKWSLVAFVEAGGSMRCHGNTTQLHRHSRFDEDINQQYNCDQDEQLCFAVDLDLLYSGCYVMQSRALLAAPSGGTAAVDTHVLTTMTEKAFLINDSLPYSEIYNQAEPLCKVHYGNPIVVHWYLGHVPVTDYTIDLERETEGSSEAVSAAAQNCSSPRAGELTCQLPAGLPPGRYSLRLQHDAPWTRGNALPASLKILRTELEYDKEAEEVVTAHAPYWAAAGCGAAGAGAAALLVLLAARRHRALARLVKSAWSPRYNNVPEVGVGLESTVVEQQPQQRRRVVLLYARDCAPLMQAAAELRALLQLRTEVFDLHCPETLAALAPAPATWLRAALAPSLPPAGTTADGATVDGMPSVDTAVVLLETPAAAMLYGTTVGPDGAVLAPLLGRRVLPSPPAAGDALLSLALQLLRESPPPHTHYRHLYIATVDASAPLLPHTQRYRRYTLPGAAPRLLLDACGLRDSELPACGLARLRAALDLARQHARDHPDYLRDHLVFL